MRIRWRLPLAFAVATLVFAGIVALVAALALRGVFLDRLQDDMTRQAKQYAATLAIGQFVLDGNGTSDRAELMQALRDLTDQVGDEADARFTVIDNLGWVLADSEADPGTLENHGGRPEVVQALAGNEATERRYSSTLDQELVYVAVPLPAGDGPWSEGVVRVARPASAVDATVAASWRIPLIVWAVLLLPTLVTAYLLTRSITNPLRRLQYMTAQVAAGDFTHRTSVRRKDELGALAESLNTMAAQLETRNGLLRAETESSSQMLSAMTEGVLLADSEGRLVRNNPAAERILGVDLSQAQGTPLVVAARAFPSHSLAETARIAGHPITEVLELPNGQSLAIEVLPLTTDYGPEGDVRSTTEPGDRPPMLFVIRDETARRNTERMRRDFATNVSHELKTPLAGLSLLAETLGRTVKKDPDQAEKFVTQLSNEISRLTELANDLLTLSRLEEPGTVTEAAFVPINVSQLIAEAVDEVRAAADAKGHHLTVNAAPELRVLGDEVALSTMLRNLVENAVRYTEPGGHLEIHAEGRAGEDDRHWVVMEVIDDGVGIPLTDQQRVFERFYRVDKARSRETGGTGLGLSIVRHVAERHGGRVELTSTVGVGSTFTVHLPAI